MTKPKQAATEVMAYPPLTRAAAMVGVAPSTLSRRTDLEAVPVGDRDLRIPPPEVMRIGDAYKKVPLEAIAADLVRYADNKAPTQGSVVREQVGRYLAQRAVRPSRVAVEEFVTFARLYLPAPLAQAVAEVFYPAPAQPARVLERIQSANPLTRQRG